MKIIRFSPILLVVLLLFLSSAYLTHADGGDDATFTSPPEVTEGEAHGGPDTALEAEEEMLPHTPAIGPMITTYRMPCQGGTGGRVSTFHGMNEDGNPPLNPNRRSYDVTCNTSRNVFAPIAGTVYGTYSTGGGMILIDDTANNACLVVLHMGRITVGANMVVQRGTYLGQSNGAGGHVHLAAVNGRCRDAGGYNSEAKNRERDIKWPEIGEVLPANITAANARSFTSQNPGDIFATDARSTLTIGVREATLLVCAPNLQPGRLVYVSMWRGAVGSIPARSWPASARVGNSGDHPSNCAWFADLDGLGDTLRGLTYYTVAALNPIPGDVASLRRTSCYTMTGGAQLCDAGSR